MKRREPLFTQMTLDSIVAIFKTKLAQQGIGAWQESDGAWVCVVPMSDQETKKMAGRVSSGWNHIAREWQLGEISWECFSPGFVKLRIPENKKAQLEQGIASLAQSAEVHTIWETRGHTGGYRGISRR